MSPSAFYIIITDAVILKLKISVLTPSHLKGKNLDLLTWIHHNLIQIFSVRASVCAHAGN